MQCGFQNFCLNVVISGILFIYVWKTKLRCIFLIWIALKPTIFNSNFISLLMIWVYDLNIFYWRKCHTTLIIYKKNTRCLVFKQTIDFCSVWKPQLKIKYHKKLENLWYFHFKKRKEFQSILNERFYPRFR